MTLVAKPPHKFTHAGLQVLSNRSMIGRTVHEHDFEDELAHWRWSWMRNRSGGETPLLAVII